MRKLVFACLIVVCSLSSLVVLADQSEIDSSTLVSIRLDMIDAEEGDAAASTRLGERYYFGVGVPRDLEKAVHWYRLGAEQGHALAQNNLGLMYNNGEGVVQDYQEAVKWYRLSAAQGYSTAQNSLGFMYARGQGVIQNQVLAHMWFNIAASQGASGAVQNRDLATSRMTPQ